MLLRGFCCGGFGFLEVVTFWGLVFCLGLGWVGWVDWGFVGLLVGVWICCLCGVCFGVFGVGSEVLRVLRVGGGLDVFMSCSCLFGFFVFVCVCVWDFCVLGLAGFSCLGFGALGCDLLGVVVFFIVPVWVWGVLLFWVVVGCARDLHVMFVVVGLCGDGSFGFFFGVCVAGILCLGCCGCVLGFGVVDFCVRVWGLCWVCFVWA